jgi:hypothetical protein
LLRASARRIDQAHRFDASGFLLQIGGLPLAWRCFDEAPMDVRPRVIAGACCWWSSALIWGVCFSLFSLPAAAQSTVDGSIRGIVRDEQGAILPGVTITATSPDSALPKTTWTDATGSYKLRELAPGVYKIAASLTGFTPFVREKVPVRAGLNLGLDLSLSVGGVAEAVTVATITPMLEIARPGQSVNISGQFQRETPLTSRHNWAQFLEVTPGIVSTQAPRSSAYFFHGSSDISHVLQIDGFDVASAVSNSPSNINLSVEVAADIQVKTGAVTAAAPLGAGAVTNLVSRSGTDMFHGSAGTSYQPKRWNDRNSPQGTSATIALVQPEGSLGGPIMRERLWFFAAAAHTDTTLGISRSATQLANLRTVVPSFDEFGNNNTATYGFVKVTSRLSNAHDLLVSYHRDRNPVGSNLADYANPLSTLATGGPSVSTRLSSTWGPQLVTRVGFAYNGRGSFSQGEAALTPSRLIYQQAFASSGRLTGSTRLATLDNVDSSVLGDYSKAVVTADVTWEHRDRFGAHEVQAGTYLAHMNEVADLAYANQGFYREELVLRDAAHPELGAVPFHRIVAGTDRFTAQDLRAKDYAFYVQDLWRPTTSLTVSAGLRIDAVRRDDRLFDVPIQNSTEVGPRLGATYVLTSDARHIVHASWARVHDAVSTTVVSAGRSVATVTDSYDLDLNGSFETTFVTPGSTLVSPDTIFDPGFHQGYVNELTLGYRVQLPGNVALDASWLQRQYRDLPTVVDVNGIYDGGVFRGYRNEALNSIGEVTNNRWNWPVYHDAAFQVAWRGRGVELLGSYVRQWRHLAGTWEPNDPAGFIQPDAFPNDHAIEGTRGNRSSSRNSYSTLIGPNWLDHALRVAATAHLPFGVDVSSSYSYQSGFWSGPILTRVGAADPQFGPATLVLGNGRLVSNPLATTLRFDKATRGEGQLQSGSVKVWNVRVARRTKLPYGELEAGFDLYNATNNDADQNFASTSTFSADFGRGTQRQLPRSGQLVLRYAF